jgi:hypothetical protein
MLETSPVESPKSIMAALLTNRKRLGGLRLASLGLLGEPNLNK